MIRQFIIAFLAATSLRFAMAQAPASVAINNPTNVQACGTTTVSWSVTVTDSGLNALIAQQAINTTYVGIWVSNVGVAQPFSVTTSSVAPVVVSTPSSVPVINTSGFISTTSGLPGLRVRPRQNVVAPVTKNVTAAATPLSSFSFQWTPVAVTPNEYYVMYLRSLPGHPGGLDISVQTAPFFVAASPNQACLQTVALTSSSSVAVSHTSSSVSSTHAAVATTSGTAAGANLSGDHKSGGVNGGAIAGGVVGGLAALALLLLLLICLYRRRQQNRGQDAGPFLPVTAIRPPPPPISSSTATSIEKDGTPARGGEPFSPTTTMGKHDPAMGVLSAVVHPDGSASVNSSTRRKPAPETYGDDATNFSPDTTVEGGDVGLEKRGSGHTHKSSSPSVTTFAQAPPSRRVSQRSTKRWSTESSGREVASPSALRPALPEGAAPPAVFGVSGSTPPSDSSLNRTPSARKPVRKKAPELPADSLTLNIPPPSTTSTNPPSSYYTPIAGGPNYSQTSLGTPRTGGFQHNPDRDTRRSSDALGFEGFAGARDGPVHLLMPDLPPPGQS